MEWWQVQLLFSVVCSKNICEQKNNVINKHGKNHNSRLFLVPDWLKRKRRFSPTPSEKIWERGGWEGRGDCSINIAIHFLETWARHDREWREKERDRGRERERERERWVCDQSLWTHFTRKIKIWQQIKSLAIQAVKSFSPQKKNTEGFRLYLRNNSRDVWAL